MTDPLFESNRNVIIAMNHVENAISDIDDAIQSVLEAKATLRHGDLECDVLAMLHAKLDRMRNDLSFEMATLAEEYGLPGYDAREEDADG